MEEVARTPRALHAMQAVPSGAASPKYSVTSMCGQSPAAQEAAIYYPYKARVPRVRFAATKAHRLSVTEDYSLERKGSAATPTVTIYSCSGLLPPGCKVLHHHQPSTMVHHHHSHVFLVRCAVHAWVRIPSSSPV